MAHVGIEMRCATGRTVRRATQHIFKNKQEVFHAVFADDVPLVTRLCEQALAELDPDTGLDVLIDHLISEISDPLAPGLASAAALQANRDPNFARLLVTMDEQILRTITTILRRVGAKPGRTLAFPARSTARWIQNLVDASHLGIIDGPRARTVHELRRVVGWLVGRS
jgi:AcrR family transcriptional regulator